MCSQNFLNNWLSNVSTLSVPDEVIPETRRAH